MATTSVILVSHTRLSASAPHAQANWDSVLSFIGACAPDLVIHLGDLSQDGAHEAADLRHGRAELDRLPVAWRAIPGNHDIRRQPVAGRSGRHRRGRSPASTVAGRAGRRGRRPLVGDGRRLDHPGRLVFRRRSGQGIGAALIEHAKHEAAARGIALIRVDCWAGQDGSLVRVYEAYGFSRVQEFTVALPAGPWPGMLLAMRLARDAIA